MSAACPSWLAMHLKQLGGVTSFRQYMDLALNDPNAGFYGSGRALVSRNGDFVTSPALGSDVAALLASQGVRWLTELPAVLPTLSLILFFLLFFIQLFFFCLSLFVFEFFII